MPRAAREAPAKRRVDILQAARGCFAERGYHETRIAEIAARAGLSKGAIYWHFEGKRELFLELLDEYLDERAALLAAGTGAPSASEGLARLMRALLDAVADALPMLELVVEYMAHAGRDEALRSRFARLDGLAREALAPLIERGIERGELRPVPVEHVVQLLGGLFDGLLLQKVLQPDLDLEALWRQAETLVLRGLAATKLTREPR